MENRSYHPPPRNTPSGIPPSPLNPPPGNPTPAGTAPSTGNPSASNPLPPGNPTPAVTAPSTGNPSASNPPLPGNPTPAVTAPSTGNPSASNPPPPGNPTPAVTAPSTGNPSASNLPPPGNLQDKSQAKRSNETQACSLIAYHGVIKDFTDDQRKVIAEADLDGLLRILPITIRRNMCRSIAELYDPTCDAFIIDGEPLTMTARDVEHIFGIPARGTIWPEPGGKDGGGRITFAQLQKTLRAHIMTNEHGIDFLRAFILYSIGVLLCPTTQRYVSSAYLPKVMTMESIKATNFAKLSRDHLMKCIVKFNAAKKDPERAALQGTVNLEGNLPLLQFWFWEKRRLDRLDRTIDYSKRDTPLVQYWDEPKARKVCAIFDKHGLEAGETVHDLKEPWEVPRSPTPEMFDELPPTDSKLVLVLHDLLLRTRKDLMEQHLQTRVQMLRKFRHLEKENSDMRDFLYTNLNANDYWSRPEYDYNDSDKFVPSPLHGRDLASDFDGTQDYTTSEHKEFDRDLQGAQDDTTSEHKEFDKDDAGKSDATGGSTVTGQKKRKRKSTSANNKDFVYFVEPKRTKRDKITPKDVSTPRTGTNDVPDEKIVEEILDAAITLVRHMRPKPDVRADGKIYLERASVSSVLVRDGSVARCTRNLQNKTCASIHGKNYLSHDMVALPVNIKDKHWYVSVVNAKKRAVQVLDSKLSGTKQFKKNHPELENMLKGMQLHMEAAYRNGCGKLDSWKDFDINTWTVQVLKNIPQQQHSMSCGLFSVKNMQTFTGNDLDGAYTADDIPKFRKQLSALLVDSTFNSKGRRNDED